MEIKFLNQPKDVKLGEILVEKLTKKEFSRVWIFAGFAKDAGLDCLLEAIEKARKNGTIVECILGLDKKNTSKDMLLKLLNLGCKVRFHVNEDGRKLETRVYAFESDKSSSYIYLTGAKLSESGLTENISLITEIKYNVEDKKEFNKAKVNIESGITSEDFEVLDENRLKELASTGEIVARITERKIPSIKELYSTGDVEVGVQEYDENSSTYSELVNKDFDIDIDILGDTNVKHQESLGEAVELKIKKAKKEEKTEVTSKMVLGINEKDIHYDTMSTLIIPINRVAKSGATAGEIRVSSAITMNMKEFLNYPKDFHMQEDEKGKLREVKEIILEIFENGSNKELKNEKAILIQNEKSTILKSDKLIDMEIAENDIMRFIKQDENKYRCEIIKKDSSEYSIWENFCTISVKGTSKKFGIL